MTTTRRRVARVTAALGALSLAVGCATGEGNAEADSGPLVVGLVAPATGFAANYGPEALEGLTIALENADSQAAGREIEIVQVDEDVLDSSQTLERIKSVVERDGASIVIGPVFGSNQQAVSAYLTQQGIPMFTMLGGGQELAGDEGSAFIWPAADSKTAAPLGTYAAEELGYDTIATLAPDYAYGHDAMAGAVEAFEAAGGEVTQQQWVPLGTTDMLQYATAMDRDVDALLMWLVPGDAASFVREYRNLGIEVPLLMFQGVFDPTYQEIGASLVGELGLNEYNHLLDYPQNREFTAAYAERYDGIPNHTTAFAYTVATTMIQALEDTSGDTSVDALRDALDGKELDTVIGTATYDSAGIASSNREVVRAVQGSDGRFEWEPLMTYEDVG